MLESVTRDSPIAAVTVCDAASHGLREGDRVRFTGVVGMEELNGVGVDDAPKKKKKNNPAPQTGEAEAQVDGAREVSVAGPYAFTMREVRVRKTG